MRYARMARQALGDWLEDSGALQLLSIRLVVVIRRIVQGDSLGDLGLVILRILGREARLRVAECPDPLDVD